MAPPRKAPQVPGDAPEPEQVEDQPAAPEPSGLPRACDIDPTTLTKSVLTADGWVCPA